MKFVSLIGVVSGALFLTSCGIISDRSSEYVRADAGDEIIIPEWYSDARINSNYPIPEIENNRPLPRKYQLPEPPDATAVLNDSPYVIESLGGNVWLNVFTSPGQIWPLLDFFWREYKIDIAQENISKGRVVTQALGAESSQLIQDALQDKGLSLALEGLAIQAELKQGVRRNTSELHLALLPNEQGNASTKEAILDVIGAYVTSSETQSRHSLLATDISTESKVRLLEDENNLNYLELELAYERAWSEVDQALLAADVDLIDRDRSAGVFFLHAIEKNVEESWFDFGSTDPSLQKPTNYEVRLKSSPSGIIRVDVKIIGEDIEESKHNELISLVFEHIS